METTLILPDASVLSTVGLMQVKFKLTRVYNVVECHGTEVHALNASQQNVVILLLVRL